LEALIGDYEDIETYSFQSAAQAIVLDSIKHLLDVFDSCIASENQSTILAWPAIVDSEFLDLLSQKEDGSLVALAYYGAVLHVMTKAWWMEGWGKFLVILAADCLDEHAQSAIAWPLGVIKNDERSS
jgi:hypothetical protein